MHFCNVEHIRKRSPGDPTRVKFSCGSNAPVYFRIRHREPCENQLQRRKMLAKSGSGNNAQTAGNQEFWRNIQGRLRVSYRSFLDRFCAFDEGTWSREDPCCIFSMKFPLLVPEITLKPRQTGSGNPLQ